MRKRRSTQLSRINRETVYESIRSAIPVSPGRKKKLSPASSGAGSDLYTRNISRLSKQDSLEMDVNYTEVTLNDREAREIYGLR